MRKLYTVWLSTSMDMAVLAESESEARKIAYQSIDDELGAQDIEWDVDSVTEGSPGPHWNGCYPYRADGDESPELTCDQLEPSK